MITFSEHKTGDNNDVLVVELSGRLITETADSFFRKLEEEIQNGHRKLVVDCKALEFISSLGLGMMVRAHSRMQSAGGEVRFARIEGLIEEAFRVVGFHKLFGIYPSVEEAAQSF